MSAADWTKFKSLTLAQKKECVKELFKDGVLDDTILDSRALDLANAAGLCPSKLQHIKNAITKLGY